MWRLLPLNWGRGAVPESASRQGPAPILAAAVGASVKTQGCGWQKIGRESIWLLVRHLMVLYVFYLPKFSQQPREEVG